MAFSLSSPAFSNGEAIPAKYTCDGGNLSPPLQWSGAPNETRGFLLIVEDPDAPSGVFRHWAVYDLPANVTALPEDVGGQRSGETLNQRVNDFGHANYDGPCPPRGHGTHHYHFRLAALDTSRLVVSPGAKVFDIWRAAEPYPGPNGIGRHLCEVIPAFEAATDNGGIPCCLARLHNETKPSTSASSQPRLFDFADSFHDFGHRMVLLFRQLIDEVQDVPRGLVLSRIRFQIPLGGREFGPLQVMSELGG